MIKQLILLTQNLADLPRTCHPSPDNSISLVLFSPLTLLLSPHLARARRV